MENTQPLHITEPCSSYPLIEMLNDTYELTLYRGKKVEYSYSIPREGTHEVEYQQGLVKGETKTTLLVFNIHTLKTEEVYPWMLRDLCR